MLVLTRKEKADLTRTEEYVRERIEKTLQGIKSSDITFLDEIYYLIDARVEALDYLSEIRVPVIDEQTPVDSDLYNTLARDMRELSELNLGTIKDVYQGLSDVYNDIYSEGESITSSLAVCNDLLSKAESTLKNKMSLTSIKDEIAVIAIGGNIGVGNDATTPSLPSLDAETEGTEESELEALTMLSSSEEEGPSVEVASPELSLEGEGLSIDQYGGFITLEASEKTRLDYTIKSIDFT